MELLLKDGEYFVYITTYNFSVIIIVVSTLRANELNHTTEHPNDISSNIIISFSQIFSLMTINFIRKFYTPISAENSSL